MAQQIAFDPCHDQSGETIDLLIGQCAAFGNAMPFFDASSAAGRRRMLRGEHGMTTPRRLLAVMQRLRITHAGA